MAFGFARQKDADDAAFGPVAVTNHQQPDNLRLLLKPGRANRSSSPE